MSNTPEQPQDQKQQQAMPREESALPVSTAKPPVFEASAARKTAFRVLGSTLAITIVMSVALEYAGWQIAFKSMPTPHTPIPLLPFLRGVWDTTLGAVGIGAAGVVGSLLIPSTWRNAWRRVPAAFALGAAAFIGFLSFVTFGFFR